MRSILAAAAILTAGTAHAATFLPSPGLQGTTDIDGFVDPGLTTFFGPGGNSMNANSFSGQTGGGVIDDSLALRGDPPPGTIAYSTLQGAGQINTIDAFTTEMVVDIFAEAYVLDGYVGSVSSAVLFNMRFEITEDMTFNVSQTGDPENIILAPETGTITGNILSAGIYELRGSLGVSARLGTGAPDKPNDMQMTQTVIRLRSAAIPAPAAFGAGLAGLGVVATRRRRTDRI